MPASGRVQGIDVAEVAHWCVGHITALFGDCILPLSTGLVQQGGHATTAYLFPAAFPFVGYHAQFGRSVEFGLKVIHVTVRLGGWHLINPSLIFSVFTLKASLSTRSLRPVPMLAVPS